MILGIIILDMLYNKLPGCVVGSLHFRITTSSQIRYKRILYTKVGCLFQNHVRCIRVFQSFPLLCDCAVVTDHWSGDYNSSIQ